MRVFRTFIGKSAIGLAFIIGGAGVAYLLFPAQCIDMFRYFPYHHNPFEWLSVNRITELRQSSDRAASQTSTLVKFRLPLGDSASREVIAYLPGGYDPRTADFRYPVIYLLHGAPGQDADWVIEGNVQKVLDAAIAAKRIPPLLAVFPDGNGGSNRDTEFINSADGKEPNEDFIVRTVVEYVDRNFPTLADPEYRAIGGFSSGGFGALNLGLKHQEVFGYILSFSGYGRIVQDATTAAVIQGSATVVRENSPADYIPSLTEKRVKILLMTGSGVDSRAENSGLADRLRGNGFRTDYIPLEGGHKWDFWGPHLADGLDWLNQFLK